MRARDQIEIIEAAYVLDASHDEWQRRLTELVAEQWDGEAASLVFDATDPLNVVRESVVVVGSEKKRAIFEAIVSLPILPEVVPRLFQMGPHLVTIEEVAGPVPQERSEVRVVRDSVPDFDVDMFSHGLKTLDPSHRGLLFALSARSVDERTQGVWSQLATHVGIAFRLRRELAKAAADTGSENIGEAVVDLDGRCRHAEGAARSAEAREVLREAALAVMRARSSLRDRDPDEAVNIWRGLVSGRWSLVDHFDSDGKHFLIAHKNPPQVRDRRALTERESQVAGYLAMGLPNKLVGYALGLSASSVADHAAAIRRKLGVQSRVDLVRLLGALDTTAKESAGRD